MIRAKWVAALAAAGGVVGFAASANAGPLSSATVNGGVSSTSGIAEQVHDRGYRHCHWRGGFERCHGGYGYRHYDGPRYGHRHEGRRYGDRPGIHLYFGSRDRDYDRRRWR